MQLRRCGCARPTLPRRRGPRAPVRPVLARQAGSARSRPGHCAPRRGSRTYNGGSVYPRSLLAPRLGLDAADWLFPAPTPRPRVKSLGLPPPVATAPRVGAPALCLFRGRAEEGAAGTARAEAPVPEAERTVMAGPGRGKWALIWAGLGGRLVSGPSSTPLAFRFLRSVLQPVTSLASVYTSVKGCSLGTHGPGVCVCVGLGQDEAPRAGRRVSHCLQGRPGRDIWERGGPGGRRGAGARGALPGWLGGGGNARCLSGEEGVAVGEASFPIRRKRGGRDRASSGPQRQCLLLPGREPVPRPRAQSGLLVRPGGC